MSNATIEPTLALRAIIIGMADTGIPFTADDVRKVFNDLGCSQPKHVNHWGQAFASLSRSGYIVPVLVCKSERAQRNSGMILAWVGA